MYFIEVIVLPFCCLDIVHDVLCMFLLTWYCACCVVYVSVSRKIEEWILIIKEARYIFVYYESQHGRVFFVLFLMNMLCICHLLFMTINNLWYFHTSLFAKPESIFRQKEKENHFTFMEFIDLCILCMNITS